MVLEAGVTVILAVVAPVLQENDVPPLAVSVALAPAQIDTMRGEIEGVGKGFTVTVLDVLPVQPLASVTVTENEVVDEGLTIMLAAVEPMLQENDVPPPAVNVEIEPAQIVTVAGEMVAVTD